MNFSIFLPLLISSFIPCDHKWYVLRLHSAAQHMISPGECSLCTWEEWMFWHCCLENMYITVTFIQSAVLFRGAVSLPTLCLDDVASVEWGAEMALLFRPLALSISKISRPQMLSTYVYKCSIVLVNWPFHHCIVTFFVSDDRFWLKVSFIWCQYSSSCSLWVSIFMGYLFPSLYFQSLCVLKA